MLETFEIPHECNGLLIILNFGSNPRPMLSSHYHKEIELLVVKNGKATYHVEEDYITLTKGSIIWFPSMMVHQLVEVTPNTEFIVHVFKDELIVNNQLSESNTARFAQIDMDVFGNIVDTATQICPLENQKPQGFEMIQYAGKSYGVTNVEYRHSKPELFNAGMNYIYHLAWNATKAESAKLPIQKIHPSVLRACQYLNEVSSEVTLPELGVITGLSPSRLSRVFKKQLGISLSTYRNQIKVDCFLRLYNKENKNSSLTELAYDAGFGSYAQFYRVFHQITGFKPSDLLAVTTQDS